MEPNQTRVKQFMDFFGQKTADKPTQISEETAKLRANLILEEAFETITQGLGLKINILNIGKLSENGGAQHIEIDEETLKALAIRYDKVKEVDLQECADGLSDLCYVIDGAALTLGVDMEPINKEVHKSNMSKAWTLDDLELAKTKYPTAKVEKYSDTLYRLVREDGKIIKSPNYKEADLVPIIEAQKA